MLYNYITMHGAKKHLYKIQIQLYCSQIQLYCIQIQLYCIQITPSWRSYSFHNHSL